MPKKKFIDKKNATTFVVGHRSQKDPLIVDENAPKNILIPLDQVPNLGKGGVSAACAAGSSKANPVDTEARREEQRKYGVYFDDDYNYLQHLKDCDEVSTMQWDVVERIYAPVVDINEPGASGACAQNIEDLHDVKIKLPSSVFESEHKEEVGLLNKAAPSFGPRPDLDPDVIAALDDDFNHDDPDNLLEDNFLELANQGHQDEINDREPTAEELDGLFSDDDEDNDQIYRHKMELGSQNHEMDDNDSNYEDEEDDSLGSLNGHNFDDEETKSHFTNYSMSSSCVRRNKQLLLVDDRFEKLFESYEDTEIGALDCDEIEGDINPQSDILLKYAEEFEKERNQEAELNSKIALLAMDKESSDSDAETDSDDDAPKEKWDCQSIISTYSTTKNRPKIIRESSKKNHIRVSSKTGIPVGVLGKGGLTKNNLKVLDDEYNEQHGLQSIAAKSVISGRTSIRNKDETPYERKERKNLVKEYRRERRIERKANTDAFKEEKKRIEKVRLNSKVSVQGLKL